MRMWQLECLVTQNLMQLRVQTLQWVVAPYLKVMGQQLMTKQVLYLFHLGAPAHSSPSRGKVPSDVMQDGIYK